MGTHYLPRGDEGLLEWARNFVEYAAAHPADLGLMAEDVAVAQAKLATFKGRMQSHYAMHQAARAERQAKDASREDFVRCTRGLVRRIQAAPGVTDPQRAALGIPRADRTPTDAPVPASEPKAIIDTSERLRHTIRFFDAGTPTRKARPRGVMGCEIWVKVGGGPPTDERELVFLALDTASPYVAQYKGSEAGKMTYYRLRWVNTRGQRGPWSAVAEATITG